MPLNGDHFVWIIQPKTWSRIDITPHLFGWKLYGGMLVYFLVQGITIGSYSARLAGVQTSRIATSISLFNLFMLVGRLSALLSVVLVAPLSDTAGDAIRAVTSVNGSSATNATAVAAFQHNLDWQLRLIVLGGTLGMIAFSLFMPMFTYMFRRGIGSFERRHSMLHALAQLLRPAVILDVLRHQRIPPPSELFSLSWRSLPKRLLIFNIVVTAVYSIGVPASYLASVLDIGAARTAVSLSGIINGVGTIAFTLFVDPTSALIMDQAAKGQRPVSDVRTMVFYLALTAIIGTLVSQLIFFPSAEIIAAVAHFFTHLRG